MTSMNNFPPEYRRVNRYVDEIYHHYLGLSQEESKQHPDYTDEIGAQEDYGSADFFVKLKDGRIYEFTAYTPESIREGMDRDGDKSRVEFGLLIVHEVSWECLLDALEECLRYIDEGGLDKLGVLVEGHEAK